MSENDERRRWQPARREQRLRDVNEHGRAILEMVHDRSRGDFVSDKIRRKAVTYDFQCLSEAVSHLLRIDPQIAERYPDLPWTQIRAIANVIRHAYGAINVDTLWDTATGNHLREVLAVAERELGDGSG